MIASIADIVSVVVAIVGFLGVTIKALLKINANLKLLNTSVRRLIDNQARIIDCLEVNREIGIDVYYWLRDQGYTPKKDYKIVNLPTKLSDLTDRLN